MALGGDPLGHRYIWWNLVSSRKEPRIEQAKADWKAGRMSCRPATTTNSSRCPTTAPAAPADVDPAPGRSPLPLASR